MCAFSFSFVFILINKTYSLFLYIFCYKRKGSAIISFISFPFFLPHAPIGESADEKERGRERAIQARENMSESSRTCDIVCSSKSNRVWSGELFRVGGAGYGCVCVHAFFFTW